MRKSLVAAAAVAALLAPVAVHAATTAPQKEVSLLDQIWNWVAGNYPNIVNRTRTG